MEYYSAFKNEGSFDTCYSMEDSGGHYDKWNKPVTKRQILYDSIYMGCYQEQKNSYRQEVEWWLLGWEGKNGELQFNGYTIFVSQDEKSSRDGWGDGSNNINYLIPLNCTLKDDYDLKNDYNSKFYVLCILPQ